MGRGRAPCCDKSKVNKGPWSPAEDLRLITFIHNHGHPNWRALPKQAGLLRCGKSCRLRWINYLRPDLKRGSFTKEEEETIIKLHQSFGNKWSKIASHLPGRTDNEIKNVWNTHLKKMISVRKDVNCHKDESNEYSSITSSSTPSSSTIDHEPKEASSSSSASNYSNSKEVDFSTVKEEDGSLFHSDDQAMIEIPFESDIDFWDILDKLDPFLLSSESPAYEFEASQSTNFGEECDGWEIECHKWLKYLENELGLEEAASDIGGNMNHNPSKDAAGELGSHMMLPSSPQSPGI